jgi:hypothetical protein
MTRLVALVAAGALGGTVLVLAGGDISGYCHSRGSLPDAVCTPGSWVTHRRAVVCAPGYRGLAIGERSRGIVLRDYGIPRSESGRYRIVAVVPLQLGGSRKISNLWPLALARRPGLAEKQRLDLTLGSLACSGRLTVYAAQQAAARNWVRAYQRLVVSPARARRSGPTHSSRHGPPAG